MTLDVYRGCKTTMQQQCTQLMNDTFLAHQYDVGVGVGIGGSIGVCKMLTFYVKVFM